MLQELIEPRSPHADLMTLVLQETERLLTTSDWQKASGEPEIPRLVYIHLITVLVTFPQEVSPLLLREPLLRYLHAQLDPQQGCSLTLRLLARDGRTLASSGEDPPLEPIRSQALDAPTLLQDAESDVTQGTFPIPANPQVLGSLVLRAPVPLFLTADRVLLLSRYAELAALTFPTMHSGTSSSERQRDEDE